MEAYKLAENAPNLSQEMGKTTQEKVRNTFTDEIIIGICAPIGTSKKPVIEEIERVLKTEYKYDVEIIKLSERYINKYADTLPEKKHGETPAFTSLMNKIVGGNQLRTKLGDECLVELAILDIYSSRTNTQSKGELKYIAPEEMKSRRKCFIIDSLKNKDELDLLRQVYKEIFYCFSIFSPKEEIVENLRKKGLGNPEIKRIIETDEFENDDHGQNVRNTFIEGDFFVRISKENEDQLPYKIKRYLSLIFEDEIITPNPHEIAMYEAKSAAGNSACLSRQVGAAITNDKGEIISRGWNDVPKFGGNLYKDGEELDHRCIKSGFCSNDKTKDLITDEILINIFNNPEIVSEILNGSKLKKDSVPFIKVKQIIRKSTRVKDLIEFSRSVHAEMHAIIIGSQLAGNKMVGGKLFCTTYPCHNCARHMVVAGIKEAYYIEPYKKSLGLELHDDTITEDEKSETKVKLLVYDGVAPRRFLEFFLMSRERKDKATGQLIKISKPLAVPKTRLTLQALPTLEAQAIHSLKEHGLIN